MHLAGLRRACFGGGVLEWPRPSQSTAHKGPQASPPKKPTHSCFALYVYKLLTSYITKTVFLMLIQSDD